MGEVSTLNNISRPIYRFGFRCRESQYSISMNRIYFFDKSLIKKKFAHNYTYFHGRSTLFLGEYLILFDYECNYHEIYLFLNFIRIINFTRKTHTIALRVADHGSKSIKSRTTLPPGINSNSEQTLKAAERPFQGVRSRT